MTVIKINAITVPADSGDALAERFAARAGAVDNQEGFEGFELLKPTDDRTTWLVITRWADEASFDAWVNSPAFGRGHQGDAAPQGGGHPGSGAAGHPGGEGGDPPPVAMSSELWSYVPAGGSTAGG
ncbi:MAG: antibiotic biosynthesis monooxygenase family protein [Microthrixaceae bacterium]